MDIAIQTVENEKGRWNWVITCRDASFSLVKSDSSLISFKDRADAEVDARQHLEAQIGADGRPIRTKDQLQNLIHQAADQCADCADAVFGGVYWHARDEMGCNWSISTVRGGDWGACMECVNPAAIRLRQVYNIADER
ncbi:MULTISPECIES: hypothetical protein [unclassified Duganella]|uniref:hypothetical protein n=1 Tax=unclassified Duganella TaxID=2636909 RepID=UPI00088C6739|nr:MULTISPECIES: hypothetical protein [unclassified Duganella]SDF80502.1 hypothetical protein SAMN05216320_1011377 [Duganella sp. OV458]SDI48758.1 hypothetical protein SAMN05428973_10138 [Duganella sp. OV510]